MVFDGYSISQIFRVFLTKLVLCWSQPFQHFEHVTPLIRLIIIADDSHSVPDFVVITRELGTKWARTAVRTLSLDSCLTLNMHHDQTLIIFVNAYVSTDPELYSRSNTFF